MLINQKKTKTMIFNYTNKYQFTTRLNLNAEIVEVVPEVKLLGTFICNDLTWNKNTASLVKRANARMILLRKLSEFGAPIEQLKTIYTLYIRSVLEQSAVVWHSSLTQENSEDLSRVQKSACKIILKNKYESYEKSLEVLDLQDLSDRRQNLCKDFATKAARNQSLGFSRHTKSHPMNTRNQSIYEVSHCNTERLLHSAIPQMQRLLNTLE